MGRFSKLEPTQPSPAQPGPAEPTLPTRPEPGAPGRESAEERADRTAAEWLALGDHAYLRGDFKPALRWYSRALDKDTTLLEGWVSMVRVLLFRRDLGQAETWANRALTLFPNSCQLLALRAAAFARRGLIRQALNNSDAILAEHAADPIAQIARGEVLLLDGNKNADFCFTQALTLVPANDWKTPATIGMIYEERRMWAKAIQFYTQAAERNESSPELWYRISGCRAELGHSQQARRALEQARELCSPDDPLLFKINHAGTGTLWNRVVQLFKKK